MNEEPLKAILDSVPAGEPTHRAVVALFQQLSEAHERISDLSTRVNQLERQLPAAMEAERDINRLTAQCIACAELMIYSADKSEMYSDDVGLAFQYTRTNGTRDQTYLVQACWDLDDNECDWLTGFWVEENAFIVPGCAKPDFMVPWQVCWSFEEFSSYGLPRLLKPPGWCSLVLDSVWMTTNLDVRTGHIEKPGTENDYVWKRSARTDATES